ncbi:MAG: hypothetical protein R6X02_12715 [Enhygromyxa sp.]
MHRTLALALLALLSSACDDVPDEPQNPESFVPGDKTGLVECDAVIEAYAPCIDAKAPEPARANIKANMERSFAYWMKIVRQPSMDERNTELFRYTCIEALEAWTRTATAWGCEPPRVP